MEKQRKKKILVGGTFDILHMGHLKFLKFAKKQAHSSELVVVIARDATVKKGKGHPPIFGEEERRRLVKNLKMVDKAILGKKPKNHDFYEIISSIKPDLIVLGHDQPFKEDKIKQWAKDQDLSLDLLRAKEFNIEGISSSSEAREKVRRLRNGEE